jgi:hypothetical protein
MALRSLAFACAALLCLATPACSGSPAPPASCGADGGASPVVLVATCDYDQSSEVGFLSADGCPRFYSGAGGVLGGDPALASSAGRLFWLARDTGDVLELDPRTAAVLHGPWTTNDADAGGTSDPQDIAVDPVTSELWIARFNVSTIEIKSSDGSADLGHIDLSGVAGVNRNPDMSSIRIVDGKAYVALEMLDDKDQPTNPSYLVRLDVASRTIDTALELKGRNPFGLMVEDDSAAGTVLYLADPGSFALTNETDAGIERVDLASFTSELVVRESDIGASVDQVSVAGGCLTAIVAGPDPANVTSLISVDLASGTIATPLSKGFLYTDAGFELAGMAWLGGGVNLVGDRTAVPGKGYPVHAIAASSGCALTETALSMYAPQGPVALEPVP